MKRCSSPYSRMPWTTSARYALSPQLTSCSRTPEMTPVVQLKMREKSRRRNGSFRRVFQPDTRSKPSSSFARSCGISAGSSWRSASMVTITSPPASRKPAWRAAAFPIPPAGAPPRRSVLRMEPGQDREARVGRAVVDEDDLEQLSPWLECGRDLVVQLLERALLVEQRKRRPRSRHGGYRPLRSVSSARLDDDHSVRHRWRSTAPHVRPDGACAAGTAARPGVRRRRGGDRERDRRDGHECQPGSQDARMPPRSGVPEVQPVGDPRKTIGATEARATGLVLSSLQDEHLRRTALPPGAGLRTATASSTISATKRARRARAAADLRCRPGASGEKECEQAAGQNRHRARVDAELDSLGRCARGQ